MTDAARGPGPPQGGRRRGRLPPGGFALLTALGGVAVGVLVFVLVANNIGTSDPSGDTTRADPELFVAGQASSLANAVRRDGPILLPDLVGRSRNIYLQHLGGKDWRAFEAAPPGAPARCVLGWSAATRMFTDSCSPTTYPADGRGLVAYPTRVDDEGRVVVDLRQPSPPLTDPPVTDPPASAEPRPGAAASPRRSGT